MCIVYALLVLQMFLDVVLLYKLVSEHDCIQKQLYYQPLTGMLYWSTFYKNCLHILFKLINMSEWWVQ